MDMREINRGVIAEFRENDGQLSGPMAGAPVLLLTTTGRRSGSPHTTPIGFVDASGKLAAAAANGGADDNPDWFDNLSNNPTATIEVPGATVSVEATITEGEERERLLEQLVAALPGMSEHVAATSRAIPVVVFNEAG